MRLPLLAAAMIFIAAVTSTQLAIFIMSKQSDRQVEVLGQVYLDGLLAALLPFVTDDDHSNTQQVFRRALEFHQGVVDRRLIFLDSDRRPVADVAREGSPDDPTIPTQVGMTPSGLVRTDNDYIWIWRELEHSGQHYGIVAANLDVSSLEGGRGLLRVALLLFDLAFSFVCAVIGFFMVQRIQKPVTLIARRLYEAVSGSPKPISETDMPRSDPEAVRMFHAFNAMAHAAREREKLLAHIAEQEREAILGRIIATLAHEIRNPLGGMRTAISTLKRFGDRPATREEAVGFLDRGVHTLEEVVSATLASHRAPPRWRWLSRQDFEDLRLLVEADGRSRNISIVVTLDMDDAVPIAALEVRQVLLNLLLNAVRASPEGATVRLDATASDQTLAIVVEDDGAGLKQDLVRSIEAGTVSSDDTPGLGITIVTKLVKRLQGQLSVRTELGHGTTIFLKFPFQREYLPA
ncbi:sensor histidine kinase [Leptospira interrogans]